MSATRLILLPGLDGTGKLFAGFIQALPETFTCTVVSYPADNFRSYTELLPIVETSVPQADPFVLLAESFSTPLAVIYAATKPRNLVGLVICSGFVSSPVVRWSALVKMMVRLGVLRIRPPKLMLEHFLLGEAASAALVETFRQALQSARPDILRRRVSAVLACDARVELSRTNVPIVYLRGTGDRLVGKHSLDEIRQIRPDTISASIAGPHLLLQREPRKTAELIARLVEQLAV